MNQSKTILITGGAGFIGSHIADRFIALGHNVIIIDDLSSGRKENINPKAKFYEADIRDRKRIEEIFSSHKIDILNHHAAQMDVRRSVADPLFDASVNISGSLTLFEACAHHDVKHIMFASTGGAIYGEQVKFPADESHPANPASPYGITKLACEKYLAFYRDVYGIRHSMFRYTNVYGPRQNPHGEAGVDAILINKLLRGEVPLINGDGLQTRDYVYVGDVANAHVAALQGEGSSTFNVCTGMETDVNTLYKSIRNVMGSKTEATHGPAKAGEQLRSVCSYQAIAKAWGWKPEVRLEEGLRMTADFFKKDG